jgi:1,4-dihydroxy-2-naphthoyl-CoA hydrolase
MREETGNANIIESGLARALEIAIVEATPQRVTATMPITPRHHQPFGYLHGGASLVLAETVASIGSYLNCPPGKAAFGMEINANHVRPAREGTLTAVATPLHLGRHTHVWDIRILDERERLICVSRCTVAVVDTAGA